MSIALDGVAVAEDLRFNASCPFGTQILPGSRTCGCRRGFFQLTAQLPCEQCPFPFSSVDGAVGVDACDRCTNGCFHPLGSSACEECPSGATCPWNSTIETILVKPNYWRFSPFANTIYKCSGDTADNATELACVTGTQRAPLATMGHVACYAQTKISTLTKTSQSVCSALKLASEWPLPSDLCAR
eukprot:5474152-Prymnesium_polylepis.2